MVGYVGLRVDWLQRLFSLGLKVFTVPHSCPELPRPRFHPRQSTRCLLRRKTWNNIKHHQTVTALMGVAFISFSDDRILRLRKSLMSVFRGENNRSGGRWIQCVDSFTFFCGARIWTKGLLPSIVHDSGYGSLAAPSVPLGVLLQTSEVVSWARTELSRYFMSQFLSLAVELRCVAA